MEETGGLRETPVTAVEDRNGAIVVRLAGELDLYNAHLVRDVLSAAAKREPERLVVELSGVTLIEARTKLANRSAFLLAGPGLETRRALEISGLDRHFTVHESLGDALSAPV